MKCLRQILKAVRAPSAAIEYSWKESKRIIDRNFPFWTNVFERDWDVLVVLDACRYDLFTEFVSEHQVYQYINDISSIRSVGSTTRHWIPRTFTGAPESLVSNTHYVTCTSYAEETLDESRLHQVDHVWKYAKNPEYGLANPQAVTDAAIDAFRTSSADRIVLHYIQPHAPFLHCLGKYDSLNVGSGNTQQVWWGLENGEYDREEVWNDYGQNLLRGLDEVHTLVRNTEGKVVITSDHGNGLGECGVYGHPPTTFIGAVRKVPWVEIDGLGINDYEIKGKAAMTTNSDETSVEEQLEALGYR